MKQFAPRLRLSVTPAEWHSLKLAILENITKHNELLARIALPKGNTGTGSLVRSGLTGTVISMQAYRKKQL